MLATVFAGADVQATDRAREYFTGFPPSSPSIALLRGGKLLYMMERRDIEAASAERIADQLMEDPDKALDTKVREELGLDPDELGSSWGAAIYSFVAFGIGAVIPLVPFLLASGDVAFISALALSFAALFAVGAAVSIVTGKSMLFSGVRQVLIGAAAAAVTYGFCPYLFAHTAHIQLLLCGGIPICLLLLHRLADAPSVARGLALALALVVQALACAYYGVFAGLLVAYAALFLAVSRGLWRSRIYWVSLGAGAATTFALLLPWFSPYLMIRESGFGRTLQEASEYSANVQSYLASPAHAHGWLLALIAGGPPWTEVLFPGLSALAFGAIGFALLLRRRGAFTANREIAFLYASIALLAMWVSFGPAAGLYALLFKIPVFDFLRAPARIGILVPLALSVFAAFAFRQLLGRLPVRGRPAAGIALCLLILVELHVAPFRWEPALPESPAYRTLAAMPRAPLAAFPFYSDRPAFPMHTRYMVYSTVHWQPMLNGYSDFIPDRFRRESSVLGSFPSKESFNVLRRRRVRYISLHWPRFGERQHEIRRRLEIYKPYLRTLAEDDRVSVYEIRGFP